MTGFGAGKARLRLTPVEGRVTVEVKSVNQRFLDLRFVLPKEYSPWEAELRNQVQAVVSRGRVEVNVSRAVTRGGGPGLTLDLELARAWVGAWRRLQQRLGLPGTIDLSFLKGVPEFYRTSEPESRPEAERPPVQRALADALRQLDRARSREGRHLERDMRLRVKRLERLATGMAGRAHDNLAAVRQRIEERMREILGGRVDEGRVVQEAAFQAERGDVTEELVRLRSHLAGLRDLFGTSEPVGKRIEFLLQEVQREVNTVASKSNDLALTRLAVEAKGEIEKIREQVQNVE
ncbi:MAG: YicC/YloC family endoribonuclease [Candidatus Binatia bacterium]